MAHDGRNTNRRTSWGVIIIQAMKNRKYHTANWPILRRVSQYLILNSLLLILAVSCSVDFSPNAKWKEVPVVYCLIDQDDDTSWVRVERCYLSESDIYSPAQISDSVNYDQGSISVALLAFDAAGMLRDSIPFTYTLRPRNDGNFVSGLQPVYYSVTAGRLRDDWRYKLSVRRTSDGSILAASQNSIPLIRQVSERIINKPSYTVNRITGAAYGQFAFYGAHNTCLIEWDTMENGRLYQPIVRFYYSVAGDTTYIDVKAPSTASRGTSPFLSVNYPRYNFLTDIKTQLQNDPSPKKYLKMVDIYLTVASEDYNAYISSINAGSTISQGREPYTNIDGGLGIFASRRTHLYKWMPADSSNKVEGLYTQLRNLGVGIE